MRQFSGQFEGGSIGFVLSDNGRTISKVKGNIQLFVNKSSLNILPSTEIRIFGIDLSEEIPVRTDGNFSAKSWTGQGGVSVEIEGQVTAGRATGHLRITFNDTSPQLMPLSPGQVMTEFAVIRLEADSGFRSWEATTNQGAPEVRASQQGVVASIPRQPSSQLNVPFIVKPYNSYMHPDRIGFIISLELFQYTLYYGYENPAVMVDGTPYFFRQFPRDTWVQLTSPQGERVPVALHMSLTSDGMVVSAMWLPLNAPLGQPPVQTSTVEEKEALKPPTGWQREEEEKWEILIELFRRFLELSNVPQQQLAATLMACLNAMMDPLEKYNLMKDVIQATQQPMDPQLFRQTQVQYVMKLRRFPAMKPLLDLYDAEHPSTGW